MTRARQISLFIAAAALLLVAWTFYKAFAQPDESWSPVASSAIGKPPPPLPTTPELWNGRIDYRLIDRRLQALAARPEMVGVAVAIVEDGKLSFVKGYGVTDFESNDAVEPSTVFRWASLSKGVAGMMAALLASEGKLSLNDTVAQWGSSLRLPGGGEQQLTVGQLLSHQTGLTKNAYDGKLEGGENPAGLRMALSAAPQQCAPGTCHSYQNVAFDAASEIEGKAGGELYGPLVEDQLFKPLGMKGAGIGMDALIKAKSWARPHRGHQERPLSEAYFRVPAAAGVSSSILDLERWMEAQMGLWPKVLKPAVLNEAHKVWIPTRHVYAGALSQALKDPGYGLGWRSFSYRDHRLYGHSGAVDGYRSTMVYDPARKTGVVMLWNSNWGRPFAFPLEVLDSYYGFQPTDWLQMPMIEEPQPPNAQPDEIDAADVQSGDVAEAASKPKEKRR
ncbi:serine hydrolase domain-containing protein [Novosphingopyxis sp.]|uniref:serine hydrolase domain-containing protein n=1 Tax=Novosphingopyxis sp. TaxID=2709690 RepID=UPI003B5A9116